MKIIAGAMLVIAASSLIAAQPVAAQRTSGLRAGINPIAASVSQPDLSAIRARIRQSSHWKEGAAIGTLLVATPLAIWTAGYAESVFLIPVAIVGGLVAGAITGGVVGALIGGLIPKEGESDHSSPESALGNTLIAPLSRFEGP